MFEFNNAFWGVLAGIIVGVLITLMVDLIKKKIDEKNKKTNFNFELKYNISHIKKMQEELVKYRNAVNGDNLKSYFGYYPLSKTLNYTINAMFYDGSIYNYLSETNIEIVYRFLSEFSIGGEQYINNQVSWNRENINTHNVKQMTVGDINFWEQKFIEYENALVKIKL